jgi:hypothetical protein
VAGAAHPERLTKEKYQMDILENKSKTTKSIFRISMSVLISLIAAKIAF